MAEQHLDLDGLADLLAVDSTDAHLQDCARCSGRLDELRAALDPVAVSLAALPLPAAPADLDSRLSTALDALRSKPARTQVPSLASRRTASRRQSWLPIAVGVAAAAALVLAVTTFGGSDTPSSQASRSANLETRTSNTGLSYTTSLLATELPALLNGTALSQPSVASDKAAPAQQGKNGSLSEQAPRVLVPGAAADPLTRLRTPAGLASCITALSEGTDVQLPLALDYASFSKQPALVVVLPSTKQDKVDVFVVGAGCAQADANLLYFARLPAPS